MTETRTFPNYVFDKKTGWRIDLPSFIPPGTRVLNLYATKNELAADEAKLMEIGGLYNDMLDWAFAYDKASNAAKKVIISHLIERVDVYRDYKLKIKFRIGIEQFLLSVAAIA